MGDFDKNIIIDFFEREQKKAELNLQSQSNALFNGGDISVYGNVLKRLEDHYNGLTEEQKKTAYYNPDVLHLSLRQRLNYFLILEELMVDKDITLDDLADVTSEKALERKRQAGDNAFDFFTNPNNTKEEMGEKIVEANKRLRDKIEAYNNQLMNMGYKEDKDGYFKKVSEIHSILNAHFEGHNETDKVGVPKEKFDINSGLSILMSRLGVLDNDIKEDIKHSKNPPKNDKGKISKETLFTEKREYDRSLAAFYLADIKQKELLMDIISSGKYRDPLYNGSVQAGYANVAVKGYLSYISKSGLIGALTDEELYKLVATPELLKKIEAHYTPVLNDNGTTTLTYEGLTIYDSNGTKKPDPQVVEKFRKTLNREFDKAAKESFKAKDSQRMFDGKDAPKEFVQEFIDALAAYKQELEDNTWGRYIRSSANYRSMQDEIDSMIDRFKNVDPADYKKKFSDFKYDYERMLKSIKIYVEDKNGFEKNDFDGEYETKRVEAAKDAYYRFEKFQVGMESLEDWQKERESYKSLKEQVNTRFKEINNNNSREFVSKQLIDEAKKSALNIAEIYKNFTKPLTDEQKSQMQTNFDKICELSARRYLLQKAGDSRAQAVAALKTEELMEVVRSGEEYKKLFDHPENLTASKAKDLIELKYDSRKILKGITDRLTQMANEKMVELKLDADPDLSSIDEAKMYTSDEVTKLFREAVSEFGKNSNMANYAKAFTFENVYLTLDKNNSTISGKDIFDMVLSNKKAYDVLASHDEGFKTAVSEDSFYECQKVMKNAVEKVSKNQEDKAAAKENVVQKEDVAQKQQQQNLPQ